MVNGSCDIRIKVLLFNPPGKILIRGEARSDSETDPLTSPAAAKWIYPPMNLAYGAAVLRKGNFKPVIRDYPAERKGLSVFAKEAKDAGFDICVANLNFSSQSEDLKSLSLIKRLLPHCRVIAYAPYLALYALDDIPREMFDCCDALLIAEHPEALLPLAESLYSGSLEKLESIKGIVFLDNLSGKIIKTAYPEPGGLNELPLPARDLLNNRLYLRPDNSRPQALIQAGRGCPFGCKFCLVPSLTGKIFTQRSINSVMEEIEDCIDNFGIRQFFFRADTFTIDRQWVKDFCQEIINKRLKISWCANSRADTADEELFCLMRRSGCWLLAFGFESGSPETLKRINKGNSVFENERIRKSCRRLGIKVHGQYIIGFPWETSKHLEETFAHIRKMQCDFIDVQLLVPYKGTALYKEMRRNYKDLISESPGSKIQGGITGTAGGLSKDDLLGYQRQMLRATYLSPLSIFRKMSGIRSLTELVNYTKYGAKFSFNQFFKTD